MKAWDAQSNGWFNVSNTINENVNRKSGFYLFVRGDRRIGPGSSFNNTVLRSKGLIYDFASNPSYSVIVPAATFISVGNPFASSFSIDKFFTTNFNDLEESIWLWD